MNSAFKQLLQSLNTMWVLNYNYIAYDYQPMVNMFLFNCYLAVPRPTLGHSQRDSLTNLMLITAFVVRPEGHRVPCNEVGSLSLAESLTGFEPGTFRF